MPTSCVSKLQAVLAAFLAAAPLIILLSLNFCLAPAPVGAELFEGLRLAVYVSPPALPADGKEYRCVYVQIQDLTGKPLMAPSNVTVTLTSSNLDVGIVESPTVIAEGESFSVARFNTTLEPGVTIITASAPGYIGGSAALTTVSPAGASPPFRLNVYASPSVTAAEHGLKGVLCVQLADSAGTPIPALTDIHVTLASSNTTILDVPLHATIKSGSSYAQVSFTVLGSTGEAAVTALATGFLPGSTTITVLEPGGRPAKLALKISPPTLPPDGSSHSQAILIQLLDVKGAPAKAAEDIQVYISTSNVEVGEVEEAATIRRGEYYTFLDFRAKPKVGEAVIAAAARGLEAATAKLEVEGPTPSKLSVYVAPPIILADGKPKNVIAVQVQAENGAPIASNREIHVHLTTSSTMVGSVPAVVTIAKGESHAVAPFIPALLPGTVNITASAHGLEPADAAIEVAVLPLNITVEAPSAARINQTYTVSVTVTADGFPVQGAALKWTVTGGEILAGENLTDVNGNAQLTLKQTSETLKITVQAAKLGYATAVASKSVMAIAPKPPSAPTLNIFGFEIPLLTVMTIIAVIVAAMLCTYTYLKRKARKT